MRAALRRSALLALSVTIAGATLLIPGATTPATAQTPGRTMTTASGLKIEDTKVGTGASPTTGQTCVMHYTGWLYENGKRTTQFDSSVGRAPFQMTIGVSGVIRGWTEGLVGMKVGGKRELIIPPDMGYGAHGAPPVIPPGATLDFEIELLRLTKREIRSGVIRG